jgi:dienelactone hydrolase
MRISFIVVAMLLLSITAMAQLHTETIEYKQGDTVLEGYLAYDSTISGPRPGVLIVHEWMGLNDYARYRADMLAKEGYIAFAADIYGKGVRPQNTEAAAEQAGIYREDRELMRARAQAGLEVLREHELSESTALAAIGYCFGGGVVLELARSGADVAGVISFHGNLDTPNPADAERIKGSVLVCHGAADPYVPREEVEAFHEEMHNAEVDWYMIEYGGAVHSFTNHNRSNDPSQGAAYDANADRRSWRAMLAFFDELFE